MQRNRVLYFSRPLRLCELCVNSCCAYLLRRDRGDAENAETYLGPPEDSYGLLDRA